MILIYMSRDSSVSKVAGYGLNDRGLIPIRDSDLTVYCGFLGCVPCVIVGIYERFE
jgi:hypothetical protein